MEHHPAIIKNMKERAFAPSFVRLLRGAIAVVAAASGAHPGIAAAIDSVGRNSSEHRKGKRPAK
jgi:hypothetical protein